MRTIDGQISRWRQDRLCCVSVVYHYSLLLLLLWVLAPTQADDPLIWDRCDQLIYHDRPSVFNFLVCCCYVIVVVDARLALLFGFPNLFLYSSMNASR